MTSQSLASEKAREAPQPRRAAAKGVHRQAHASLTCSDGSVRSRSGRGWSHRNSLALAEPRAADSAEVWSDGFTQVHLVNPGGETAEIVVEVLNASGRPTGPAFRGSIAAGGTLVADLGDLFPGLRLSREDYISVTSNPAVVAFEYFGEQGRFTAGVNGREGTPVDGVREIHTELIAPQYAQSAAIRTSFSVVNLEDQEGFVDFVLHADGSPETPAFRRVSIPARGKIHIDDEAFFGWTRTAACWHRGPRLSSVEAAGAS